MNGHVILCGISKDMNKEWTEWIFLFIFRPRKGLSDMLKEKDVPDDAVDLLNKLLQFNPDKRISADQTLKHPYVKR